MAASRVNRGLGIRTRPDVKVRRGPGDSREGKRVEEASNRCFEHAMPRTKQVERPSRKEDKDRDTGPCRRLGHLGELNRFWAINGSHGSVGVNVFAKWVCFARHHVPAAPNASYIIAMAKGPHSAAQV